MSLILWDEFGCQNWKWILAHLVSVCLLSFVRCVFISKLRIKVLLGSIKLSRFWETCFKIKPICLAWLSNDLVKGSAAPNLSSHQIQESRDWQSVAKSTLDSVSHSRNGLYTAPDSRFYGYARPWKLV